MYNSLFDKHHKLHKLSPAELVKGNKKILRPSSGEYEGGLLCCECDNEVIGQYESYGKRALFARRNESPDDPVCENGVTETGIPVTRCTNIDYKKFKLFLLSILWRASISTRGFFREVHLGPYEDQIRRMILDDNPGNPDQFPVILLSWLSDKSIPPDFVAQPGKNRATKGIRYVFPVGGMTYVFHISPDSFDPMFLPFTILPNNQVTIFHIPDGMGWKLFAQYFKI